MSLYPPKSRSEFDLGITRKLQEVGQAMGSIIIQGDLVDFLNDLKNVERVDSLVEDIHYAMMDYQVCTTYWIHSHCF